ncbi:MAG: hypothetical protein P8P29_05550 [Flavobacteriaceae bacterium]|nr:hypothetical protein [Phycisphaerae bacterium]MDG1314972.1 hypothetical protein [Flavobacteriaceae bacterium]
MKLISTRHFGNNSMRFALVGKRGRKWTKVVVCTSPIRVVKVDNKIADKFEEIVKGDPRLGTKPKAGNPVTRTKQQIRELAAWTYKEGLPKTLTNFLKGE